VNTFRLAAVQGGDSARPVLLVDDRVIDVRDALAEHSIAAPAVEGRLDTLAMLDDWDRWLPVLERVAAAGGPSRSAKGVKFLAPIRYPRKLLMAGANYVDHVQEMKGPVATRETHRPFFFLKPPTTSIIAAGEPLLLPDAVTKLDWEAELVAVVGRRASRVPASRAGEYIAGYTVMNDFSARDKIFRTDWTGPFLVDWLSQKGWATFGPMGPSITPRQFVPNVYDLSVRCTVNGELKQDGNTKDLIFTVEDMVEFLSAMFPLEPGDCIATGTPAGVGMPRGTFLKSGDVVVAEVAGICRLETAITAAS
jgi:2-keto-4-pentenoate hydratase/2-oxohepta-3-ene-1,7-dioic acid hydratase in catechol pathway